MFSFFFKEFHFIFIEHPFFSLQFYSLTLPSHITHFISESFQLSEDERESANTSEVILPKGWDSKEELEYTMTMSFWFIFRRMWGMLWYVSPRVDQVLCCLHSAAHEYSYSTLGKLVNMIRYKSKLTSCYATKWDSVSNAYACSLLIFHSRTKSVLFLSPVSYSYPPAKQCVY
jgi:hypothetical protein